MSCSETCWLLGGAWFQCRYGWALADYCSLESGVFWCSQVLYWSLLPLAFSLILTVASRFLPPYNTNDKTSRLMVKRFSTVEDTQRTSHGEEKRKWVDRGGQEERRGSQKERDESSLWSVPYVSSTAQNTQRFTELSREEKGEGGDRGDLGEKRESQKGREQSSQ